jgi:transcriptional repressor NrdR
MNCPECDSKANRVLDSSIICRGKMIKRRRQCKVCKHRWTTIEQEAATAEEVVKRAYHIIKAYELFEKALGKR